MADSELKYLVVDRAHVHDALVQAEWSQKKLVWVPHPELGFVTGKLKQEKGEVTLVELEDGSRKEVVTDELQKMNPPKFEKVEDMAELSPGTDGLMYPPRDTKVNLLLNFWG